MFVVLVSNINYYVVICVKILPSDFKVRPQKHPQSDFLVINTPKLLVKVWVSCIYYALKRRPCVHFNKFGLVFLHCFWIQLRQYPLKWVKTTEINIVKESSRLRRPTN